MNLLSNISKMGTLDQYYAKFLVSVENLTTAFYKFMGYYNKISKIMIDPSEFYKHEYPQEYVDAKTQLENAILEYQHYITDPLYGIIRTTHLNVEFGYSAFRIVQSEKRIMSMIEGFNMVYTDNKMTEESYAYAGLSFLESQFNAISILISQIVENFPIPKKEENTEEVTDGESDENIVPVVEVDEDKEKETSVADTEAVKKGLKKKRPLTEAQ